MTLIFSVPASVASNGKSFIGVNSDRLPNESQSLVRYARLPYNEPLELVARQLDLTGQTANEMLVGRPFDQWGIEMGVNEFGLTVAVSTVVSRFKKSKEQKPQGISGQEMARLALSFCATPSEALIAILNYQKEFGLANDPGIIDNGFTHGFSFLVGNQKEQWILEVAGSYWAKNEVKDFYASAGAFAIEEEIQELAEGAEEFARSRKWIKAKKKFNFAEVFGLRKVARQSKAAQRKKVLEEYWKGHNSPFDRKEGFELLQFRLPSGKKFHPGKVKLASPEQYATGKSNPWQTVNSMLVEFHPKTEQVVWFTGSSSPSVSIFKPFVVPGQNMGEGLIKEPGSLINESLWWKTEVFHRVVMTNYQACLQRMGAEREALQASFCEQVDQLLETTADPEAWNKLSQDCLRLHLKKVLEWNYDLKKNPPKSGQWSPFYRKYIEELTARCKPLIK